MQIYICLLHYQNDIIQWIVNFKVKEQVTISSLAKKIKTSNPFSSLSIMLHQVPITACQYSLADKKRESGFSGKQDKGGKYMQNSKSICQPILRNYNLKGTRPILSSSDLNCHLNYEGPTINMVFKNGIGKIYLFLYIDKMATHRRLFEMIYTIFHISAPKEGIIHFTLTKFSNCIYAPQEMPS